MQKLRILRWSKLVDPATPFHLARRIYMQGLACEGHQHDFPELFWLEKGQVWQIHEGRADLLAPGEIILVHPEYSHAFRGIGREESALINLAFPREVLDYLENRYAQPGVSFWGDAKNPKKIAVSPQDQARLSAKAENLFHHEGNKLELDAFLLDILRLDAPSHPLAKLPPWLRTAMEGIESQGSLRLPWAWLVARTGRTREHISRVIKQATGRPATCLINNIRLAHAAKLLSLGNRTVLDICFACGYCNVSHFYKLFQAEYGHTPRRYRLLREPGFLPVASGSGRRASERS